MLRNVKVTPAKIAEELLKSDNLDGALGGVVKFLEEKIPRNVISVTTRNLGLGDVCKTSLKIQKTSL